MKRIVLYSGLAVALFLALNATEAVTSGEPFVAGEFAVDLFETALLALAVVATAYSAQEIRDARIERTRLLTTLSLAHAEREKWRSAAQVHIDGLAAAIGQQFAAWRLTAGECDVAILMLKGLSHKEIAKVRNSSDATVRQQAAAIYAKSGLANRAGLAAYFLDDLFPQASDRQDTAKTSLALVQGGLAAAAEPRQQLS